MHVYILNTSIVDTYIMDSCIIDVERRTRRVTLPEGPKGVMDEVKRPNGLLNPTTRIPNSSVRHKKSRHKKAGSAGRGSAPEGPIDGAAKF